MSQERWTEVDDYLADQLIAPDPVLDAVLRASADAELPVIQVSALQGKLLWLLARAQGASRILEIGTLGGYSTIWLARALPSDGRLVSLELDPAHAELARANLTVAGLADRVEVRIGPALESLSELRAHGGERFDFVFIDADKAAIPSYVELAVDLSRPGTLIVVDNVVRAGEVLDAASPNADVQGIRAFYAMMATRNDLEATTIQTVGTKGHDGLALVLVTGDTE